MTQSVYLLLSDRSSGRRARPPSQEQSIDECDREAAFPEAMKLSSQNAFSRILTRFSSCGESERLHSLWNASRIPSDEEHHKAFFRKKRSKWKRQCFGSWVSLPVKCFPKPIWVDRGQTVSQVRLLLLNFDLWIIQFIISDDSPFLIWRQIWAFLRLRSQVYNLMWCLAWYCIRYETSAVIICGWVLCLY